MMLIPLAIGLFVRARYEDTTAIIQPTFGQASNIAILVLTVLGLVLNFKDMIGLVGSWGILAGVIFVVASLAIGYLLGGSESGIKSAMALGTGQRNIFAALVVAGQNFGIDGVTYLMVIAIVGLVVLMPLAGELGKRQTKATKAEGQADTTPVLG
jgi:BASS family bile acid:Na+ symporter